MKQKTKAVLKNIVKECLIELLAEGLTGSGDDNRNSLIQSINEAKKNPIKKRSTYLDSVTKGIDRESEIRKNNKLDTIVNSLTSDSLMSDILKDTANTTLMEQVENKNSQPSVAINGDSAARLVNESDPVELFSDSASKWASLAFSEPVNK